MINNYKLDLRYYDFIYFPIWDEIFYPLCTPYTMTYSCARNNIQMKRPGVVLLENNATLSATKNEEHAVNVMKITIIKCTTISK